MATYEDLKKANETIKTTEIKGNQYAEVPQRIKAFRMVYPEGFIDTKIVSLENGVCVMVAQVGYYAESVEKVVLGVGYAYEEKDSTFINKTSYIENCQTSAVGRALGMAGFGIDTSVASFEEVSNAIANQNKEQKPAEKKNDPQKKATPKQIEFLTNVYKGENLEKLLKANNIEKLENMPMTVASNLIGKIKGESK